MILAFCIDDQGGLAFNHRRQSRDRALVADLSCWRQPGRGRYFACPILPGCLTRER